jgi:hypothetical protein
MHRFWRGVAATLLLLLSVALASCGGQAPPPARTPPPAPEPIAPRGEITLPFRFLWKPAAGGGWIYRVTVSDDAERVLFETDTKATFCQPPAELTEMLSAHAPFTWQVSIVGPNGRPQVSSAQTLFSVASPAATDAPSR